MRGFAIRPQDRQRVSTRGAAGGYRHGRVDHNQLKADRRAGDDQKLLETIYPPANI